MKKAILTMMAVLLSFVAAAQAPTGGIEAAVVDRAGRVPISGATVELEHDGQVLTTLTTDHDGKFLFDGLVDGNYTLSVGAEGYTAARVNVKVEQGLVRDLMFVTLGPAQTMKSSELDASSFSEFDLDDTGYSDAPTILYANNDVYADMVGFGFSAIRFKNRGYASETQDVYLSGVPMNDALTGYTPFSLWSGLNEAMRSKDATLGMETLPYGLGGYNGLTNISGQPYDVRPGWRFSLLSNSALYRLRLMATYASGELDNGWSYAFNVSARLGGNDWVEGVYYRSFAFYAGVSKRFGDVHRLSLTLQLGLSER